MFMTGFYSKDFILESAFGQYYFSSIAVYVIAVIGAIFTTLYSVKVLYLTFLANPNGPHVNYGTHSQIGNQSRLICDMLSKYIDKVYHLAITREYGTPWSAIDHYGEIFKEQIRDLNMLSFSSTIDPYKFKSLLIEIEAIIWKGLMVPKLRVYALPEKIENNYVTDYVKKINIAIDKYSQDLNRQSTLEGDIFLSLPLVILAIFSIFFGYLTKDIFLGLGTGFFSDNSIFIHPNHEIMINTEFGVPTMFKLLPFGFTVIFSVLAIVFSEFLPESLIGFKFSRFGYNIFGFFNQRFLVDHFYNKYIVESILKLGGQTTKVLDKGAIELIGPFGLELGLIKLSKNIASLNTGVVTSYALYILVGMISYLTFNMFIAQIGWDFVLLVLLAGFSLMMFSIPSPSCPNPSTQVRDRGSEGGKGGEKK